MTPELKAACELVFQEHKASAINWNKDAFRGRLSFGLSAMAKQILERRNIICTPNPGKKAVTILNPAVGVAANFEEAEEIVLNKTSVLTATAVNDKHVYISHPSSSFVNPVVNYTDHLVKIDRRTQTVSVETKWYLKPLFYYFVWPACAAIGGGFVAYFLALFA